MRIISKAQSPLTLETKNSKQPEDGCHPDGEDLMHPVRMTIGLCAEIIFDHAIRAMCMSIASCSEGLTARPLAIVADGIAQRRRGSPEIC